MKKLILIAFITLSAIYSSAENKLDNYKNIGITIDTYSYQSQTYNIKYYNAKYYINLPSNDGHDVALEVTEDDLNDFVYSIYKASLKYKKWEGVSKQNNITSFKKKISTSTFVTFLFDYNGSTKKSKKVNFNITFEKTNDTCIFKIKNRKEIKAKTCKYQTFNDISLSFTNIRDINIFLNTISFENLNEKSKSEQEKDRQIKKLYR